MNFRVFLTRLAVAMAASLLFAAPASAASPNPAFPVGHLAAYPLLAQPGFRPMLQWSIDLPPGAGDGDFLEGWRQAYFGSGDNSGDGADSNDFDHDGIPNLVEYAFGLDPQECSSGHLPAALKSASDFYFSFTPPAGIHDIVYGAEWSPSLLADSWTPVADSGVSPGRIFSVPMGGKPSLYLRLKVTGP